MPDTCWLWIEPVDVLYLRGNRLFGAAGGDDAGAQLPPQPSVVAGALRSALMAAGGATDLEQLRASGSVVAEWIGTVEQPGTFRLEGLWAGRRGAAAVERFRPLPADLVVTDATDEPAVHRLRPAPREMFREIVAADGLPWRALLSIPQRTKPAAGRFWLTERGWRTYRSGGVPAREDVVADRALWRIDPRLGIGLDAALRSAADGMLYTTDAVAPCPDVGFVACVRGIDADAIDWPMLRLGGDGRGAAVTPVDAPETESPLPETRVLAIVAQTPVIGCVSGPDGLLPPGTHQADECWVCRLQPELEVELLAAIVPGAMKISGWDLARHCPKPLETAAPPGSVWWFRVPEGVGLERLMQVNRLADGLALERMIEGYNCVEIAAVPLPIESQGGTQDV